MKTIVSAVAFFALAASAQASTQDVAAQFKGYAETNRVVKERIANGNGFELGKYLGESVADPAPNGLLSLLGTYQGADTDAVFRNGDPNSVNMILWYVALNGLASDIAAYCSATPPPGAAAKPPVGALVLQKGFLETLKPMCDWPAPLARADDVFLGFWTSMMSFDAPPDEFDSWKQFFLNDPAFQNASAQEAVSAMALAALFNPYFLLRD